MLMVKRFFKMLFIFLFLSRAESAIFTVPFQNVILYPNNTIQANYSFGVLPIIFCYENNLQSVGIVTWPYKGRIYTAPLSLSLITNGNYSGSFADSAGVISITNNQSQPLVVSCEFGF